MNVTVRLFARARELAGRETLSLELPAEATIADLRQCLMAAHPPLEPLDNHLLFAVGSDYVTETSLLAPGAEVAVFPPVSGG